MAFKVSTQKSKEPRLTIYDIKYRSQEKAPYFFSHDSLKFFGQTMRDFSIYKQSDGKYLISAPIKDNGKFTGVYTKRLFNPKTNELEMVEGKENGL